MSPVSMFSTLDIRMVPTLRKEGRPHFMISSPFFYFTRFGSFFESSPKVYLALVDVSAHHCNKVDTALQKFRNAQATEDVEAFHAINSDIVEMIRELEDFSLLHRFSPPLILRVFICLRLS